MQHSNTRLWRMAASKHQQLSKPLEIPHKGPWNILTSMQASVLLAQSLGTRHPFHVHKYHAAFVLGESTLRRCATMYMYNCINRVGTIHQQQSIRNIYLKICGSFTQIVLVSQDCANKPGTAFIIKVEHNYRNPQVPIWDTPDLWRCTNEFSLGYWGRSMVWFAWKAGSVNPPSTCERGWMHYLFGWKVSRQTFRVPGEINGRCKV